MIGVYKITNKINNDSYIGSSKDIKYRWRKHIKNSDNSNSKEYEYPICRAIRKYGVDNFDFKILEEHNDYNQEYLIEREIHHYWLNNHEYNQMVPALVPIYNPSNEERLERSQKYTGEGNPFYGKTHSEETRKLLSELAKQRTGELNPFYGRHHTEETKRKLAIKKGKAVIGTDMDGNEYHFDTAKDAGEWCRQKGLTKSKTPNSDILKVCKGIKQTAFKHYWRYK